MQQTCPAGLYAVRHAAQSPGCDPLAGGQPGRFPLGHTLQSGPAALLPPAACQHWCRCSEIKTRSTEQSISVLLHSDNLSNQS